MKRSLSGLLRLRLDRWARAQQRLRCFVVELRYRRAEQAAHLAVFSREKERNVGSERDFSGFQDKINNNNSKLNLRLVDLVDLVDFHCVNCVGK